MREREREREGKERRSTFILAIISSPSRLVKILSFSLALYGIAIK